jgi:hypothetical protein
MRVLLPVSEKIDRIDARGGLARPDPGDDGHDTQHQRHARQRPRIGRFHAIELRSQGAARGDSKRHANRKAWHDQRGTVPEHQRRQCRGAPESTFINLGGACGLKGVRPLWPEASR